MPQTVPFPVESSNTGNKKRKFRPLQGLKKIFHRQKIKEKSLSPPPVVIEDLLMQKRLKKNSTDRITVPLSISHDSIFRTEPDALLRLSKPFEYDRQLSSNTLSSNFSENSLVLNEYKTKLSNLLREKLNTNVEVFDERITSTTATKTATTTTTTMIENNVCSDDHGYLSLPKCLVLEHETGDRKLNECRIFSSYSDASLFTTESSSTDLRSFDDASRESLKLSSYHEKTCDEDSDFDSIQLNHKAAHHKISIKPKKNHAIPRKYKKNSHNSAGTVGMDASQKTLETQKNSLEKTMADTQAFSNTEENMESTEKTEPIVSEEVKSSQKLVRRQSNVAEIAADEPSCGADDGDGSGNCPKSIIQAKEKLNLMDRSQQKQGQVPEFMKVQLRKVENNSSSKKCSQSKSLDLLKSIRTFDENNGCDNASATTTLAKKRISSYETGTSSAAVIRRRKSTSFDLDQQKQQQQQPELMKVFARRSLLLLGGDENSDDTGMRRSETFETVDNNSDKENENTNCSELAKDMEKISGSLFKNIRQRKEEWEKRVQQQQQKE